MAKIIEGTLPENDLRRAFIAGAKFWEYYSTGATMWQSDLSLVEDEAKDRYNKDGPLTDLADIGKNVSNQQINADRKSRCLLICIVIVTFSVGYSDVIFLGG